LQQSLVINASEFGGYSQDGLDLGTEEQSVTSERVMHRLLSEAIAPNQQFVPRPIVQGKRKHPAQLANASWSHIFVQMNDYFCVGIGGEAVAPALKFRTELREVVNLAVEYDCYRAVLVKDRLMSAGKIDDAEAAHAKSHRALRVDALIVGSAMHYSVAHGTDRGAIHPCAPVFTDDSCNPAHS
jgi:hypothetical protein